MKGLVTSTAMLGVLAFGGLPALALTLAADEAEPAEEPASTLVGDVADTARPGPPPWAQGRGPGADRGADDADQDDTDDTDDTDERADAEERADTEGGGDGPPPWAQGETREPNPGWARNHDGAMPHGWTVRAWAHCLADQAGDLERGQRVDPEAACGGKPVSPGEARKASGAAAQPPGGQGRSAAPGQQDRDVPPGKATKPEKTKQPRAGRNG